MEGESTTLVVFTGQKSLMTRSSESESTSVIEEYILS